MPVEILLTSPRWWSLKEAPWAVLRHICIRDLHKHQSELCVTIVTCKLEVMFYPAVHQLWTLSLTGVTFRGLRTLSLRPHVLLRGFLSILYLPWMQLSPHVSDYFKLVLSSVRAVSRYICTIIGAHCLVHTLLSPSIPKMTFKWACIWPALNWEAHGNIWKTQYCEYED